MHTHVPTRTRAHGHKVTIPLQWRLMELIQRNTFQAELVDYVHSLLTNFHFSTVFLLVVVLLKSDLRQQEDITGLGVMK